MTPRNGKISQETRPDFMVALGLLPPYSAEDVKQAYLVKVKTAHPDHGGAAADFLRLQEAFEQATEYVQFRASRMDWLRAQLGNYVKQQLVVQELEGRGAT